MHVLFLSPDANLSMITKSNHITTQIVVSCGISYVYFFLPECTCKCMHSFVHYVECLVPMIIMERFASGDKNNTCMVIFSV